MARKRKVEPAERRGALNIYDIAQMAGVSIATVSRVLNGSDKVSDKTRKRVLAVMEQEKFVPAALSRRGGMYASSMVGIVCPDVADEYMARSVACLEKELKAYGYDCMLYCSGYGQREKEETVRKILRKRIAALILAGSNYAGDQNHEGDTGYLVRASGKVPVFLINGYVEGPEIYCVMADDYRAVYEAAAGLADSGCRKIAFLCDTRSASGMRKLKGYEDALRDRGLPVRGERKLYMENRAEAVRDLLLVRQDLDFDGVVATEDILAIGVLKYAKIRGLRIPEDLSVVGYNNSQASICCEPELTSVDSRQQELCRLTVEHMIRRLNGEEIPRCRKIPCRLVKRSTTEF